MRSRPPQSASPRTRLRWVLVLLAGGVLSGASLVAEPWPAEPRGSSAPALAAPAPAPVRTAPGSPAPLVSAPGAPAPRVSAAHRIVAGARLQVREGATYTTGYFALAYPGGDLPRDQGVCTDVVVRALRAADLDLQVLIHEDMAAHFAAYPPRWGLRRPDRNIDHRRVPNQARFFARHGETLTTSLAPPARSDWRPGDIVYWKLDSGLDHAGVVTDRRGPSGHLTVIHNLGRTAEEDALDAWQVTGHYRFPVR